MLVYLYKLIIKKKQKDILYEIILFRVRESVTSNKLYARHDMYTKYTQQWRYSM